ncbi:MAG: IS1595 family transposase [Armatimonadota bacterium]|nr:IS1595 family transposase [Armatimonadota bacterium]
MKYKPPKFNDLKDMAEIDVARLTEDEARERLEAIRWPDGPICPQCSSREITRIEGKAEDVRDGLLQCRKCRTQFTVTVGTVMQGSHITLRQWVQAFHLMCSSKKGISALQLQRNLGLGSYRSAWHLSHRIRLAMQADPMAAMLAGTVEVDETYIGGKPRKGNPGGVEKSKSKRGRGTKKTPVLLLVQRGGNAFSKPIENVNGKTLKGAIKEMVDKNSRIVTDEWTAYNGISKHFAGGHHTVNHGAGEYARGDISTNTAESYFALLKRGVNGVFHHISKQHLHRYCGEFDFRWNYRGVTDGERTVEAVKGMVGKRLVYRSR